LHFQFHQFQCSSLQIDPNFSGGSNYAVTAFAETGNATEYSF
jgi:hypothetical protein